MAQTTRERGGCLALGQDQDRHRQKGPIANVEGQVRDQQKGTAGDDDHDPEVDREDEGNQGQDLAAEDEDAAGPEAHPEKFMGNPKRGGVRKNPG